MALFASITSRKAKDCLKASLAYVLAFAFVFSPWSTWIQPRTLPNVVLITTIMNPAKSVGDFVSPYVNLLITLCAASLVWTFIQSICAWSYAGMAIVSFAFVYTLAILRSISHPKYYVSAYVGTNIMVMCVASVLGTAGVRSYTLSDGDYFDKKYLRDVVASYLIGSLICLLVNIIVFPDIADARLESHLVGVLPKLSTLSSSIISCLSGLERTEQDCDEGNAHRAALVSEIQKVLGLIDSEISQASCEIRYSRFSMKDYSQIARCIKNIAVILFSMQTTLSSEDSVALLTSVDFHDSVTDKMKDSWSDFSQSCNDIFSGVERYLNGDSCYELDIEMSAKSLSDVEVVGREALMEFKRNQPNILARIFDDAANGTQTALAEESLDSWEKVLQINFIILASQEFASELFTLHSQTKSLVGKPKTLQIHIDQFISLKSIYLLLCGFKNLLRVDSAYIRPNVAHLKNLLQSPRSIYAFKSAFAILCLQLIMFIHPSPNISDVFKGWYLLGATGAIVVTLNPSLGQTYIAFFYTFCGALSGAALGFCSVSSFGHTSSANVGSAALVSIPYTYFMLVSPGTTIMGVLGLLAFSNSNNKKYICNSLANVSNAAFDNPGTYLYKVETVTSCALAFSAVMFLLIYPSFARRNLRKQIAAIFLNLKRFYGKIAEIQDSELKDLRNTIFSQLLALDPLMTFATAEPRLKAPFETAKYRALIAHMYRLLDRLECLRLSTGEKRFEGEVLNLVKASAVAQSRTHLIETIRLLLFTYSTAIATRQKLLPSLPNAAAARESVVRDIVVTLVNHVRDGDRSPLAGDMPYSKEEILERLNSEKWVRFFSYYAAVREVAEEVDCIAPHIKGLFGEYAQVWEKRAETLLSSFRYRPQPKVETKGTTNDSGFMISIE
ncbi:hypothetical protein BCR33DRAFT_831993 [Rhizoclosmatium globosum]|uniref:DUF2421 domain-containing protein n=1 Tax=Rhizoclosmatium globosum TaxID=329046 RepID=A0A1Y2BVA6_9FUNG|nr:hypothetical protein BCR33DRAFT_831993 [Rhizoclosmatium globosum]|eukprot:ORY38557.1 hypothetical protein BCR33DRAFT_831993 [Rhizoclosmatium globosum]